MLEKVHEVLGDNDSDMIAEVLACVMADMVDCFLPADGIPLVFAFMSNVLEKAYGAEATITPVGLMQ